MHDLIELSQDYEVFPLQIKKERCSVRLAYARNLSSRESGGYGEDFLTLSETEQHSVFVLCDGTSGSFKGDIGAKVLGKELNLALSASPVSSIEEFMRVVHDTISKASTVATAEIEKVDLSFYKNLQQIYSHKREKYGTQSTLALVVLNWELDVIYAAQLGDSILKILNRNQENIIPAISQKKQYWSSVQHITSEPKFFEVPLSSISTIIIHSDGIVDPNKLDQPPLHQLDNLELYNFIQQLGHDDISYLEIKKHTREGERISFQGEVQSISPEPYMEEIVDSPPEVDTVEEIPREDNKTKYIRLKRTLINIIISGVLFLAIAGYMLGAYVNNRTNNLVTYDISGNLLNSSSLPVNEQVIFVTERCGYLGTKCFWDFGDGSFITTESSVAIHTYEDYGTYTVIIKRVK